jgi:hypothetical protein
MLKHFFIIRGVKTGMHIRQNIEVDFSRMRCVYENITRKFAPVLPRHEDV